MENRVKLCKRILLSLKGAYSFLEFPTNVDNFNQSNFHQNIFRWKSDFISEYKIYIEVCFPDHTY